jgi:hypothetical protein
MPNHLSPPRNADGFRDNAQRKAETADKLLCQTVLRLAKDCPPGSLRSAAHDALADLRPQVEGAMESLEDIEKQRNLTDKELARRHAFSTLLRTRPSLIVAPRDPLS